MNERPKLTAAERRAILNGDYPKLFGIDRFEVGQVIELTSRVSVRIEKRNLRKGKVSYDYTVVDNRDEFLRRQPPGRDTAKPKRRKRESDEHYAERVAAWCQKRSRPLSATEIAKAGHDSAYDGNPEDPMDAGPVVPIEVQAKYSRSGWETFELVKGEELVKRQARARAERLRQAEIELRQRGKSHEAYAQTVEAAIEAMQKEARAA